MSTQSDEYSSKVAELREQLEAGQLSLQPVNLRDFFRQGCRTKVMEEIILSDCKNLRPEQANTCIVGYIEDDGSDGLDARVEKCIDKRIDQFLGTVFVPPEF